MPAGEELAELVRIGTYVLGHPRLPRESLTDLVPIETTSECNQRTRDFWQLLGKLPMRGPNKHVSQYIFSESGSDSYIKEHVNQRLKCSLKSCGGHHCAVRALALH
jgi:hypothetical protein